MIITVLSFSNGASGAGSRVGVSLGENIIFRNNVINANLKTATSTTDEVGILISELNSYITGNVITGTNVGIRSYLIGSFGNGITSNTITNARKAIEIKRFDFLPFTLVIRCNTFDNTGLTGKNYGIYVAPNAYLQSLGGMGTGGSDLPPNGNAFFNIGRPFEYNGPNSEYNTFKYYRYKSADESFKVTTSALGNFPSSLNNTKVKLYLV